MEAGYTNIFSKHLKRGHLSGSANFLGQGMDSISGSNYEGWRAWLPVISLSFAAFIFVTTELMPVGLLPDISVDMHKSEATTGLLLTIYAWVVAIMSLPMTVLTAGINRRTLLLVLLISFMLGNILVALAPNFFTLAAARICIALSHSIFWSIVTPLAVRVAPQGTKTRALSFIITGNALATVLGMPLGTLLGQHVGWRISFMVVAAAAFGVFLLLYKLLPSTPSLNTGSLASIPSVLRRVALRRVYLFTVLTVTAHFALFTYLNPYLTQIGAFLEEIVVLLLLITGGAGIAGSFIGGRYVDSPAKLSVGIPLLVLAACMGLLVFVYFGLPVAVLLCFCWGCCFTIVTLIYQSKILTFASDAADVAIAMFSGIFNIGIGGGAFLGSLIFRHWGLGMIGYGSALIVAVTLLLVLTLSIEQSQTGIGQ